MAHVDEFTRLPCGVFDTSGSEAQVIMLTGFIVEGRLSPVRLRESWDELLSKWPILAARLRPIKGSKPDKWEYHIPCARKLEELRHVEGGKLPLESRPFLLLEKPGRIRDSYRFETGSELPQDRIIAQPINDDFSLWAANSARSVSALLIEDRPMVSVQITRFEDATMVCISTPHVLCDGYGNREIMRAWTKVLEHRLAGGPELQPLAGLDKDFFKVFAPGGSEAAREVGKPTSAPVGWRAYTSWETALFLFCFLVDLFWTRPRSTIQNWEVFVPANEVKRLKDQAMDELRNRTQEERLQGKEQSAHGDSAESTEEDWVSSSDVLVGWALKQAYAPHREDKKSTFSLLYPSNLRYKQAEGLEPLPHPYLHNGAATVTMPEMPLHELHSLSLGSLALRIRRVLLAQSRPEALRNWLLWRLANCHKLCLFFPPDGYWAVFTNWRDMGLYDVDLSAALEEQEKKQATSPQEPLQGQSQVALVKKGKTIKVWSNSFYSMPLRNAFGLIANDPTGGVWIGGFLSEGQWKDPKGFGQFARRAE